MIRNTNSFTFVNNNTETNTMKTKTPIPITSAHNILNDFLKENTKYQISDIEKTLGQLDEISGDDEIWIVQCPKSIDPQQQLNEQKIKLPGKSNYDSIETYAEEFTTTKEICLGFKSNDQYKIKQFPLKGSILVREKLKIIKTEESNNDEVDGTTMSTRVPFPQNLKIRHPLYGHQFEERIQLNENIRERLKKSDEIKKSKKIKKSVVKEEYLENNISENNKKRKHKSDNKQNSKELKIEENDEGISIDLAWIKNI